LLIGDEASGCHSKHEVINSLSRQQLCSPSNLLRPLSDNKTNAQYFFSQSTVDTLISLILTLKKYRILCIGTPRMYEGLRLFNKKQHSFGGKHIHCLLLDIDQRLEQFYAPSQFACYNMFNHHFFNGDKSRNVYLKFLKASCLSDLLVIVDPPFGGLIEVLAFTMKCILEDYCSQQDCRSTEFPLISTLLFFPYFMERRILSALPSFAMLDYQVEYENHLSFNGQCGESESIDAKLSPVRIFTNIDPSLIILPASQGYWFCSVCKRSVASTNKHCPKCESCTSKNGTTYIHCELCNYCVKPTWTHCMQCGHCELPGHHSGKDRILRGMQGCLKSGNLQHERDQCLNIQKQLLKSQSSHPRHKRKCLSPSKGICKIKWKYVKQNIL